MAVDIATGIRCGCVVGTLSPLGLARPADVDEAAA